ncbi:MAG: c-type cytochrome [Gammaproteobacteria bacterium]|nr:c-type cytochrome [Gammaproteobacteria bacterium]
MRSLKLSFLAVITCATLVAIGQDESQETVEDRLKPFGNLCMQGEDCGTVVPVTVSVSRSGIEIYNAHCFACHATGVSEAPLVGAEEWLTRLNEKGAETLLANTKAGFNVVMPAMGTCMNCTDAELQAAIDYLIYGE